MIVLTIVLIGEAYERFPAKVLCLIRSCTSSDAKISRPEPALNQFFCPEA